jgi:hypothetical protein
MLSMYKDQLGEVSMQLVDLMTCEDSAEENRKKELIQLRFYYFCVEYSLRV